MIYGSQNQCPIAINLHETELLRSKPLYYVQSHSRGAYSYQIDEVGKLFKISPVSQSLRGDEINNNATKVEVPVWTLSIPLGKISSSKPITKH
jgi:hypothetical protein